MICSDFFQGGWENDRALVLLTLNELNTRATQAEQRVMELEQVLREHALGALDDTCDDSDIVTCASQHNCFNEVILDIEFVCNCSEFSNRFLYFMHNDNKI
jgi:hypothetical protein